MAAILWLATIVANFPGATDVWRAFWELKYWVFRWHPVRQRMKSSKFCQSNSQTRHISNYVYRYYKNCTKKKKKKIAKETRRIYAQCSHKKVYIYVRTLSKDGQNEGAALSEVAAKVLLSARAAKHLNFLLVQIVRGLKKLRPASASDHLAI